MSEPKPKSNTGLIIALVVGLVLLVPCVIGTLGIVGGGFFFLLSTSGERMQAPMPVAAPPMEVVPLEAAVPPPVAEPAAPEESADSDM